MIAWAVRRPAVVWAMSVAVLLAGGVAFTRLPLATKTTVELPRVTVGIGWPGASAEAVEMYLTSPLEAAIQGVRGVKRVNSTSREDAGANLTVELEPTADVQLTRLAILERVEMLRPEFPPAAGRPQVANWVPDDLAEAPLLRLTVSGPYTRGALQKVMDEQVTPRVAAVPGVAGLDVFGGTELGVAVTYDARLLRQLGIAPQLVGAALTGSHRVLALGQERFGSAERSVVLRDVPASIEALAELPVRGPGGRVFRVGDLATVRPEEDARGAFYRINGDPAIGITVTRLPAADAIKTAAAVRRAFDELGPTMPPGIRFRVVSDDSIALGEELRDLLLRGGIAFLAVTVVLALALRSWRAVALVMGSTAVAIAGTALGLYLFRIPANLLTLAGLGMGIGILVQDGVVVVQRLRGAPDTREGRAEAGRRMVPAVVGSTLTTAVVLFPFLYLQGNARAAFVPFAAAFLLALGWSAVTALVMIPALGARHGLHAVSWPRAGRAYAAVVVRLVRWRWATLLLTTAVIAVLTWGFVKRVPRFSWGRGYGEQRTTLTASLSFPRGSDPESLDRAMREFEDIVLGRSGVEQVVTRGGGTGANMQVLFTRDGGYTAVPQELEELLIMRGALVGGAQVYVRGQGPGFSSGGGASTISAFSIRLLGFSYSGLQAIAEDLKMRLEQIPRVRDVNINAGGGFYGAEKAFAVALEPDRDALARYGVTAQQFAQAVTREVRGAGGGQRIEIGGEEVPVTVKAAGARERSLEELREAIVPTAEGAPIRIGDLAAVGQREALSVVTREDQQYVRYVSYDFRGPGKLAQRTHKSFLESIAVPAGYTAADASARGYEPDDSERALWLVFAIGVTLVVLAVAMVFDSAWAAAMVFLSLPLALAGVMAAFWAAKSAFTREAAVGVILVVGLAVHQTILLIDAAVERRRRLATAGGRRGLGGGHVVTAALERSGMIVLVTLTTLASLLPLAVGTDSNSLFGAIALATTGGTIAGTLGAMLVVPAMIVGVKRVKRVKGVKGEPTSVSS